MILLIAHFEALLEPEMFAKAMCGGCLVVWPLGNHVCQAVENVKAKYAKHMQSLYQVISHYAVIVSILDDIRCHMQHYTITEKLVQGCARRFSIFPDFVSRSTRWYPLDLQVWNLANILLCKGRDVGGAWKGLEGLGMCLGPLSSLLLWLRAWWVLSRVRAGKWSWKRLTDVRTVSGPGISMMGNAIGFPLCVGLGMVTGAIVAYVQDSVGTAKFQQLWWPK